MNAALDALRQQMKKYDIDTYVVPTDDFHLSEYVGMYFRAIRFLSGFTGEGNLVVTQDSAALFTDGRYFIQAEQELAGRDVELMRMGEPGVPVLDDYLVSVTPEGGYLGFDGRCVDFHHGMTLRDRLAEKAVAVKAEQDLVGQVWTDRPALASSRVWILEDRFAGKSAAEKLAELRALMRQKGAGFHIITSLDDIAWLLNLRADDIPCNPVFLSYMIIDPKSAYLFVNPADLDEEVKAYLENLRVKVAPYDRFYEAVHQLKDTTVLLETAKTNYATISELPDSVRILDEMLPTSLWKSQKNPVEIENMKKAHVKDGVAVTNFMYFMKHAFTADGQLTEEAKKLLGSEEMNEWNTAKLSERYRGEQDGYIEPSFTTISAYGPNAALPHYAPTAESFRVIEPKGLYLLDSGGQYFEGTTDITRTIAMGPITEIERKHFTLVLKSMLRLGDVIFLEGSSGITLDLAAREVLWREGLNYNHGTGHGVGFCLNVHERPNAFRYRQAQGRMEHLPLHEGNITSDEPGIYIEGSHGIRLENLTLVEQAFQNEFGNFFRLSFLTMVPLDLDAIDVRLLEPHEIELLNRYHQQVYATLAPYFSGEKLAWLQHATREVQL